MAAALMLGASGVALGTRFYAATEAHGFDAAKQRMVAASGDDTARSIVFDISRCNVWPSPFTGRCMVNRHLERWMGRETDLLRAQREEAERYASARRAGDFDTAAVIAGEAIGLIHEIVPAGQVIEGMVSQAVALLGDAPAALVPGA